MPWSTGERYQLVSGSAEDLERERPVFRPRRLTLDHEDNRCCNRACVRPDHLEAVALTDHIRRAFPHRRQE